MTQPAVSIRIWSDDTLIIDEKCVENAENLYLAPSLPSAEERLSIIGGTPDSTLIEQQTQIEKLLHSLAEAGNRANSHLTDLMAQTTAAAEVPEDYSSGEDAGDPNKSTTLCHAFSV